MTKLEEEIISAFKKRKTGRLLNVNGVGKSPAELALAGAAAEVAKKYIEKYHHDICEWDGLHLQPKEFLNQWLKENGVI